METFLGILVFILFLWFVLTIISPKRFAPFLIKKPRLKATAIFFFGTIALSMLNTALLPPEIKAAREAKAQQEKLIEALSKNIYATSLGLSNMDEVNAIKNIFNTIDISDPTAIEHDEILDDSSNGTKGYRVTADGRKNIILYMNPNHTVQAIRYNDNDLYTNSTVIQKMSDITLTSAQQSDMKIKAEKAVAMLLKAPSTADFCSILDNTFYINNGIATIEGYVDAQNSFGAKLRNPYSAQFDVKNNMQILHLTVNGNEIF